MAEQASETQVYKLSVLAQRQHLPSLPGQEEGTTYGVVWSSFPMPAHGSCYVVKFNNARSISFLAYIDDQGAVFPVDQPITLAPAACPDFAVTPDERGYSGTVLIRGEGASLQPLSKYRGSFKGTMREVSDSETWNTSRSLTYRPFMASMYLRYCVFDSERRNVGKGPSISIDMRAYPLDEPVDIMGAFSWLPLPDAIDAVVYQIGEHDRSSGIERFARRIFGEIDVDFLRTLMQRSSIALAYIERMDAYYINFDHTAFSAGEADAIFAVEAAINRLHRVLGMLGFAHCAASASPSEEACSAYDQAAFSGITSWVKRLMDDAISANAWIQPGHIAARPGGEWDVRTRFASSCERLGLIVRLEYDYRFDSAARELRVRFGVPQASSMPASRFDVLEGAWVSIDNDERARYATEYANRMVLVLAAAAFSSSLSMRRCVVEKWDALRDASLSVAFDRTEFTTHLMPLANELDGAPLSCETATERLSRSVTPERMQRDIPASLQAAPREDTRPLPRALQDLLLADSIDELEVMEAPDDPYMVRFNELRASAPSGPARAERGYTELIEELEARCAAVEFMSDRPIITRFCENHLGRILLPVLEENRSVRINRAPDALFFARYELCDLYMGAGAFERALPEARKLLDLATTSMQSYSMLVNVLARLERFQEVIDVAKNGLRVAYDRSSIAYLFYRVAFAYWVLGDRETAMACYRLVPRDEHITPMADEELSQLLAEMGRSERPTLREAAARAEQMGVPVPPSPETTSQVADATVLLTDNGFHYLASRCVYHMWRIMARDELSAVHRSLLP